MTEGHISQEFWKYIWNEKYFTVEIKHNGLVI